MSEPMESEHKLYLSLAIAAVIAFAVLVTAIVVHSIRTEEQMTIREQSRNERVEKFLKEFCE